MSKPKLLLGRLCLLSAALLSALAAQAQSDVTQPGDPIIASSSNSPGSEGVANAIDGKPTKYLNFDTRTGGKPSGFVVSPSIGVTVVTGITLQSANDAIERDPKIVTLEGSNDDTVTAFSAGNWEAITTLSDIPAYTSRFQTQAFSFDNTKPFRHYRVTVLETQTVNGCCFQIAEVELLGTLLPQDVTQPGDPIVASSTNSPGSEGVANAIDGKPTKYLNFDTRTGGKPSGFLVTPGIGVTRVTGLSLQSANDAIERDPKIVMLEGSNDATAANFGAGNWEMIAKLDNIPAFTARFQTKYFSFPNTKLYRHYRFTVLETQTVNGCCFQIAEVEILGNALPADVTQPGDAVIASSSNSPGSEGVANVIDNKPTKYLNFDTRTGGKPSGLVVTPSVGRTLVTAITMQSANDAVERDPKIIMLEGSNDNTISAFDAGNWELIVKLDNIPAYTARFQPQSFGFDNCKAYKHYRWTVLETQTVNGCCFQLAELELHGTGAQDVTQPGDPVIASSTNSPGSEGVANAIDGKPTKYLNFDTRTNGKPSGFVVSPSVGATTIIGITLQSANDAPERDPKIVRVEGSNDSAVTAFNAGNWTEIAKLDNIPAYTARFQTQEFYFCNTKPYRHYRVTVVETQTVNGCCFQIAEVELIAAVTSAPDFARFTSQPVDTLVLENQAATFFAGLNGPWPVQWYKNGQVIPGAVKTSFTTEAVTPVNATNIYNCQIVGRETSSPAKAVLFAPTSQPTSVAVSFIGSGANGAPTSVRPDDIIGIQPQAYWNNASGGSAALPDLGADPLVPFVDSLNKETAVTFEWITSGTWGAGTGDSTGTQRMLNGLTLDGLGGEPATYTFSNVPAGTHAVIAYVVSPPLQFQNVAYKISGATDQTYYIRAMNSDEYNAAPGFYRGSSTDPANPTIASYVRFDNVRPSAAGTITLFVDMTTPGFDRGTGVNGIQLVLNATAPPPLPVITVHPQPTVAPEAGTARLTVTATGDNLTYQWRKDGRSLPNGGNVSGATTATLSITGFSAADQGIYSVAVFNAGGSTISKNAAARLSKFQIGESLAGYWKFDEATGNTAANAVSGGKVGTVNGTATRASGRIANGFTFDGATYIMVDDYAKATRQIAASAWVNLTPGLAADVTIIRNGLGEIVRQSANVGQFELGIVADANDGLMKPMAAIRAGPNVVRITGAAAFPTGPWHHLAFSADGAQLRLYVDGKEVASSDYLDVIPAPSVPWLSIGARLNYTDPADPASGLAPDSTSPNFMVGGVDDLALWNRGLSATEVGLIYSEGLKGTMLSSVVVPKVVVDEPSTFTGIAVSGGNIVITWKGSAAVQSATSVTGPYTDVAGATGGTLTAPITAEPKFYRFKP